MTTKIWDLKPYIVFEDAHLLVISKPAGLLSQGAEAGDANLVDLLRVYLGRPYVGLVHRLDRNTSGLMVVAKRSKAADRLSEALRGGQLKRRYRALVQGAWPLGKEQFLHHWLLKNEKTNKVSVFREAKPGAKEALLKLKALSAHNFEGGPVTLIELELQTGRSHQVRAQMSFEGFPLVADQKYGAPATSFPRTALHSCFLEFPHPKLGEGVKVFESPLPDDFRFILERS